jgi:4-hydroxythreonine-4-phosphate dehydrogenase
MPDPRIVITSGEPAGIGPDIIAQIDPSQFEARLVVLGDRSLLRARAEANHMSVPFSDYDNARETVGTLQIMHEPLLKPCCPGELDSANAAYVLKLLERACRGCLDGEFDAMVTAPVQKEIINRAGIAFSGHTEFLAELCQTSPPVMLLHAGALRVALVTTHLPLRQVPDAISGEGIEQICTILDRDLRRRFGLQPPHIKVCGLNPHAGENGYLGREEIDIIIPALEHLRDRGLNLSGPFPADTLFTPAGLGDADAVLAMYHDQGLPVLKHAGFHNAVNTTLGLPIVRTSVDHGTALDLAGSGRARADSLRVAIDSAIAQSIHATRA